MEDSYAVVVGGRAVRLTTAEFRVLWRLAIARGRTVSVQQLANVGAGMGRPVLRAIKSRVYAVREKLGSCRSQLITVRGAGYRLAAAPRDCAAQQANG